jgi:hypothetical protein
VCAIRRRCQEACLPATDRAWMLNSDLTDQSCDDSVYRTLARLFDSCIFRFCIFFPIELKFESFPTQ